MEFLVQAFYLSRILVVLQPETARTLTARVAVFSYWQGLKLEELYI